MSASGEPAPARRRAPTVVDVARAAGVGKTTVSAVVHGRTHVAAELRERVLAAIEELGYRPNVSARNLKLQRTDVLGVVVGNLFDPFNAEVTAHLERFAAEAGFRVLLASSGDDRAAEETAVRSLLEHRVAAVIFVAFSGEERVAHLIDAHTPTVFVAHRSQLGPSIAVDEARGGDLATTHLVELGHRRIAYVSSTLEAQAVLDARLSGYRAALERASIPLDDGLVKRLHAPTPAGRDAAIDALLADGERPTAAFAASDIVAVLIMAAAHRAGLAVPEDLSIVGFDDIALARLDMIGLTTVAQPIETFGRLAVEAAIASLGADEPLRPPPIEPRLVVRRSTAAPR